MEIEFDCECGEQVADFTRGGGQEISTQLRCEDCGTVYAITITPLNSTST